MLLLLRFIPAYRIYLLIRFKEEQKTPLFIPLIQLSGELGLMESIQICLHQKQVFQGLNQI